MKWLLFIKEKNKLVFLLPIMVILIITLIVVSKSQISQVDKSVQSIYHDRLVAGRSITQIMDLHYQNHFLLDKYIHADTLLKQAPFEKQVEYNYKQMDSIMREFRKTVLVAEEKEALQAYELKNEAHRTFQQQIFGLSSTTNKASQLLFYSQQEESSFQSVLTILRQLSMVQPRVAKALLQDSQQSIRIIQELSFLEIAFVIILFAIIEMIIFLLLVKVGSSLQPQKQKFWLN
jgi:hypothetical protein